MSKRLIWLALFAITIMSVLVVGWNWQALNLSPYLSNPDFQWKLTLNHLPDRTPHAAAPKSSPKLSNEAVAAPKVDSQRLLTDLNALSFKRYEEADRIRARTYILQALQAAGWTVQTQQFENGSGNGSNIYAQRPGTDPAAGTILLGAHYDSVERSPGADDNATGVATVLEAARLLGQQDTPRTLQLVLFDLEEQGLLGSEAFVKALAQKGTLKAAVVLDMIGYACYSSGCQTYPPVLPIAPPTDRGDFLAVLGDQGHLPLLNCFAQADQTGLPQVLTLPVPTLGPFTPDLVRSDHAPFWRNGFGAVLVTDTANFRNPHYHQSSDTLEMVDKPFFLGSAQIVINATTALLYGQDSLSTAANPSKASSV